MSPTPHRVMSWQGQHINCWDAGLHSYVGVQYQTDRHVTIHVHLFGDPGKIHIHSSLARISFNSYKIHFGILCKPFFPSFNSRFCSPENSTLIPRCAASRLSKRPTALQHGKHLMQRDLWWGGLLLSIFLGYLPSYFVLNFYPHFYFACSQSFRTMLICRQVGRF